MRTGSPLAVDLQAVPITSKTDQMRNAFVIPLLLLALMFGGCEQDAQGNPDAPITYTENWVRFSYPGSWKLGEETTEDGTRIRLQGPHDAIFTIELRGLDQASPLEDYAASLGGEQGLVPTGRPATSGRLHGFTQTLDQQGLTLQLEFHRIDSHDEAAYLVSQVPAANAMRVQTGLDRIFTTFAFQ